MARALAGNPARRMRIREPDPEQYQEVLEIRRICSAVLDRRGRYDTELNKQDRSSRYKYATMHTSDFLIPCPSKIYANHGTVG